MKCVCLLLCIAASACSNLLGEINVHHQLYQAGQLDQQGQFHQAIELLSPIVDSDLLEQGERGRAWVLLGFAYLELGEYMQAESAYEHSIQILSHHPEYEEDYATALDNFAQLYRNLGKQEVAMRLEKKALAINKKLNRHASVARVCLNLTGIELREKHRHKAEMYLSQAMEEAKIDGKSKDDFLASVFSMQAWLAELNKDKDTAISKYQQALTLWQREHGEEHVLTGLGYILLGNALARAGQETAALEDMRKGLDIIDHTLGPTNPRYLAVEIVYSRFLDHMGEHAEASRLKDAAESELARLYRMQCVDCQISAAAFQ